MCGRHCLTEVRFVILTGLARLLPLLVLHPPAAGVYFPHIDDVVSSGLGIGSRLSSLTFPCRVHSFYPLAILFYPDTDLMKTAIRKYFISSSLSYVQ